MCAKTYVNRTTKRIHAVAMIIVLVSSSTAILPGFIFPYILSVYIAMAFLSFAVFTLVPSLKAVGGLMTFGVGSTLFIIHLIRLMNGEYATLFKVLLGLICWGIMPMVASTLFIISWFRSSHL